MEPTASHSGRGRPRTITRERLADAAIAMGLPKVSVVGVAAELGVSAKAIYNHVSGVEALKQLVAETIFLRWTLPPIPEQSVGLETYLTALSASMWALVEQHTGIAPYLLRRELITPAMMAKIHAHQAALAAAFGLSFAQANELLFTVAYYSVAVADTVLPMHDLGVPANEPEGVDRDDVGDAKRLFAHGTRALIVGSLAMLNENDR